MIDELNHFGDFFIFIFVYRVKCMQVSKRLNIRWGGPCRDSVVESNDNNNNNKLGRTA